MLSGSGLLHLLHQNELFEMLPEEELARVVPLCAECIFPEDAVLFVEGREATHLYLIAEGQVALQKAMRAPLALPNCARRTTVTVCKPREIVGWSALVEPYKYTLSGISWAPSRLIKIEASRLRRLLELHPETGYRVMTALSRIVSRRLRQITETLTNERMLALIRLNHSAT